MCSSLAFSKRDSTAAPAFDVLIGMGRCPFGKLGLRAHQTLHRCNIGENETALTAFIRCRGKARNKEEFDHGYGLPLICFALSSRSRCNPISNAVNSTLRQHARRGVHPPPACFVSAA